MSYGRHVVAVGGMFAALVVAATTARGRAMRLDVEDASVLSDAVQRECPGDTLRIAVPRRRAPDSIVTSIPLSDYISDIPEFHDCQRFIVNKSTLFGMRPRKTYDSLFAIFASSRLESLVADLALNDSAVATATIYTRGKYTPLGIKTRFSCLYLWLKGPAMSWDARMVSNGDSETCPLRIDRFSGAGKHLQVRPTVDPAFSSEADYPATARWDWDAATGRYYIGIKCGAAWCEIGETSNLPASVGPEVTEGMPNGERRTRSIRGWYDSQWLATPDPLRPGRIIPTKATSFVIPDPDLATRTKEQFANGWVRVATIELAPGMDVYWTKLALRPGTNTVYLTGTGTDWRARIVTESGAISTRPVSRHDHTGLNAQYRIKIPATARWRWVPNDESVWSRCLEGCCQVLGDT